jgi:NAD+ synthase
MNAKSTVDSIVEQIRNWFDKNGPKASAVLGISGGKDSSVTAALLVRALGKDRVIGVLMPNGEQSDIEDSYIVCKLLDIKHYVVNIADAVKGLEDSLEALMPLSKDAIINIPPRVRMTTLYAIAQSLPNGGRVINTCNRSENYVGYSTKFGDAAGDFSVLGNFLVREVLAIGDELGLPRELVHKAPSDGLCGKTDEDNLGFTYDFLDSYISGEQVSDLKAVEEIERRHRLNLHKEELMPTVKK